MMDASLAKGHATAFLQEQPDHISILEWIESPQPAQAFKKFALSSQMEKEGRVLEAISPLICPPFTEVFIPHPWSELLKSVGAQLISAAPESEVFHPDNIDELWYDEKSVFLNNLLYTATSEKVESSLLTVANMSHHTIRRMLERSIADDKSLDYIVRVSMAVARDLAQIFGLTSLEQHGAYEFIIPFMGGAFFAETRNVSPGINKSYQGDRWVFSLRTFYSASMLKPDHLERMAGMSIEKDGSMRLRWLGQTREMQRGLLKQADVNHLKSWLQANARPSRKKSAVS
ncbi:hypothetical protein DQW77_14705 [Roseovarius sp. TE539]|uniref:hypothetical protein n=1 Tax=Roseovarius sp. TE539 TaxID=2249812 RepID=UPI000DDE6BEF|nr:hypothetical protein [Roseovarius sp. TE539]RBI69992.1 hypothetical protein DQW77_14705 [Roseovarius sp. TE539]